MKSRRKRFSYDDAIEFLYGLQGFGIKLGLRNISSFLSKRGNPQDSVRHIHIAGSNGKGSSAAMLASILREAGYRTALYTSPHLLDFRERARIGGRLIPREFVTDWVAANRSEILRRRLTFFETTTALSFEWFAKNKVQMAVIETGLGGRLDATNVVRPEISVITSVAKEHTNVLGRTLRSIATEKAGIIKTGVPCVSGVEQQVVRRVIQKACAERGAEFVDARSIRTRTLSSRPGRAVFIATGGGFGSIRLDSDLSGSYQAANLSVVLATLRELKNRLGLKIEMGPVRRGLRNVRKGAGLRGRLSVENRNPMVLADVAHNPAAMQELMRALRRMRVGKVAAVFGIVADKDLGGVLRPMRGAVDRLIAVRAMSERARSAESIVRAARRLGMRVEQGGEVRMGLVSAMDRRDHSVILVTGSHFVVGEALAYLRGRKYLTISQ